jgi:sugar lactone lactonase YvrE
VASIAYGGVGDLYEADFGSGNVFRFTPAGARTTFATGLGSPAGLAFDPEGNLFVANNSGNSIIKITPAGTKSTFATDLSLPFGLAFDINGNLYEADEGSGSVSKFTPTGAKTTFATGLSSPAGLAFDGSGNLFVSNFMAARIDKITPNGARTTFAAGLSFPNGLYFSSSGNLLECDSGSGNIFSFTAVGTRTTFASGFVQNPGVIMDAASNAYVTQNAAGTITKISTTGVRTTFAAGLFNPQYLALEPAIPSPAVTTSPATNVASFSATLNGSLNPRGFTTTVDFQYGLTTSYGSTTPVQTQTGNTIRPISANISSLSANTIYHFRIVAHNSTGTSFGGDRIFTTLSATGPPVVTTNPATLIASFSATLNGSLDPHGLTTSVYFQYGTTTSYGFTVMAQSQTGSTYRNVSANISGLSASTVYHFRIVATNSDGTRYGSDSTFTTLSATGAPVVTTNPATNVASSSATLNGSVDPHGLPTTVYFQYGTTTSYGFTTVAQSQTGNTYRNISANISGLTANTIYHFRIVATNSDGTRYGSDSTFTTLSATGAPVVTTNPATNVASSSATLNGSVDPHGLTTTVHFQYGTTTGYGHTTSMQSQTGNTYRNIAANISGLTTDTTYHARIVATNSAGTRFGSDRTFTTP